MRLYYLGFGNEILARRKARVKDVHDLHAKSVKTSEQVTTFNKV